MTSVETKVVAAGVGVLSKQGRVREKSENEKGKRSTE
jgi:hypothetical protein